LTDREAGKRRGTIESSAKKMSIENTVARLRDLAAKRRPKIAVILGSGSQSFTDRIDDPLTIPYAALPALPDVRPHAAPLPLPACRCTKACTHG